MNEALECSPNYPHTRSSIVTRSHVRNLDFRSQGNWFPQPRVPDSSAALRGDQDARASAAPVSGAS